jgi:hypothetical protein
MTGKSRHLLLLGLVVVIQGTIYIFKPKQRHGLYNRSKRTGATNCVGTAYPSGQPEITPGF